MQRQKQLFFFLISALLIVMSPSFAINDLQDAFNINTSGILAQRTKMMIVAENVANINTLRDDETGLPYQKKYVNLQKSPEIKNHACRDGQTPIFNHFTVWYSL